MLVCLYFFLLLNITIGCRLEGNHIRKLITAYTGDSVLLPCSCTDLHTTPGTFTWRKLRNENEWVEISPKLDWYKDRFQFVNDHSSGNLSLLISHLTVEDGGDYMCRLKSEYRNFRLTVEGCLWNEKRMTVFGNIGESALLPCSCFQLQTKPHTFRWIFLKGSDKTEISPKDQTNLYTDRVQLFNDHHPGNLSLLISHLTGEDEGRYRCEISKNDVKYVSLSVKGVTPEPRSSCGKDPLPFVAVVIVIFLHFIVAVVY
ncbi:CXADR-like membrane protein [Clarias gariepinus]|uniref:uncharacterized protein LOC128539220 n=1 Tax=Clarias gariepinus TaxID=13013 RepID=UPI00234C0536|nr:uncharacterized protein LOC128539220 [Clarias gariepinus]